MALAEAIDKVASIELLLLPLAVPQWLLVADRQLL